MTKFKTTKEIIEESNKCAMEIQRNLGIDAGLVTDCLLGQWISKEDHEKEIQRIKQSLDNMFDEMVCCSDEECVNCRRNNINMIIREVFNNDR